jgi:hypothetical protein
MVVVPACQQNLASGFEGEERAVIEPNIKKDRVI